MTNHGSNNWDVCFSDDGKTCYIFEWYSNVRGMITNEVFAPDVKNFITIGIEEKINDNNIIWTINYEYFENPEHPESYYDSPRRRPFSWNINLDEKFIKE